KRSGGSGVFLFLWTAAPQNLGCWRWSSFRNASRRVHRTPLRRTGRAGTGPSNTAGARRSRTGLVVGARRAATGVRASPVALPVVAFEELEQTHPPDSHALFVAVGYRRVNRGRRELFEEARARGYTLAVYRSPHAYVAPDVELRANTFLFEAAIIQPFVTMGE